MIGSLNLMLNLKNVRQLLLLPQARDLISANLLPTPKMLNIKSQ